MSTTECLAQKFQVKVVEISDGFVGLNRDNLQIKFRIWGIDAPEKETGFWDKNQGLFVSPYFLGENIIVDVQKQDGWGRYIAYVYTLENKDVALEMLNAGMAWHYTKYDQSEKYHNAEIKARNNKVGLWVYPRRIVPWDFR